MRRREFLGVLGGVVAGVRHPAYAQQPRLVRIGYLTLSGPGPLLDRTINYLAEAGYVEGKSVLIERRFAEGRVDQLAWLADDLVRQRVDIIIAQSTPAALAAKQATSTIPIVVTSSGDAVGSGLVASLARPGGNVTGMSFLGTEIAPKQVQLVYDAIPQASRICLIANGSIRPERLFYQQMQEAAKAIGTRVDFIDTRGPDDFARSLSEVATQKAQAVIVAPGGNYFDHRQTLVRLIQQIAVPSMFFQREYVDDGGLMSYGPSFSDLNRRAVVYVDRILKGASPADLPIVQPNKFELVINLKTAKTLGLMISESFLTRADEVIE